MIKRLFEYLEKPELYAPSSGPFWDDEHISKSMLEAHLNPNWEAASRKHDFLDESVKWINSIAPTKEFRKLLDLGCGPGLYDERFGKVGYEVTGVDFSRRSIDYAKNKAREMGLGIEYVYKDYLQIDYNDIFNLVLLIYCDYGVLPLEKRSVLLKKVYSAMRTGGKFIFDVFTPDNYDGIGESTNWYVSEKGGFWRAGAHISIEAHFVYDNVMLNQYVIVDQNEDISVYRIWDCTFTKESITEELNTAGFENIEIYSDVCGRPFENGSKTMCVVVTK